MDPSGVGHKEPDKSKAPSVLFMDPSGVGHKEPDKSKAPSVLFMDPSGVGHKEPDKSKAPSVLFMDSQRRRAQRARQGTDTQRVADGRQGRRPRDRGGHRGRRCAERVAQRSATTTCSVSTRSRTPAASGTAFKATALKGEQDALAALNAGKAVWTKEKADSGLIAATQAEAAKTANISAAKAKTDAQPLEAAFNTAWDRAEEAGTRTSRQRRPVRQ